MIEADDPLAPFPEMMSAAEVGAFLNVTEPTLAQWRHREYGPPWTKVTPGRNGLVRYPKQQLRDYLRERTRTGAGA